MSNYSWGMAYHLYGETGPEVVLSNMQPSVEPDVEQHSWDYEWDYVQENVKRLEDVVAAHPETEFLFFLPPYSILWWENHYTDGMLVTYEHTLKYTIEVLLQYENVSIYSTYFNSAEVITDLYLYMDFIHAGSEVTDQVAMALGDGQMKITLENYEEEVDKLMELRAEFHERVYREGYGFMYESGGMK